MKLEFNTNDYVNSHCRNPKGRGSWALQVTHIDGIATECEKHFSQYQTLAEAKKYLRARIITEVLDLNSNAEQVTISILP